MLVIITIPVFLKHCRDLVVIETLLERLGVGHILIAHKTSVLCRLLMGRVEEEVHLVLIAQIRREYRGIEVRDVLIAEITTSVGIIQIETHVETLAGIHGKLGVDMILTIYLVATIVIEYAGIGRQRIHKQELVGLLVHEAVGLCKDEVAHGLAINQDTTQTGCVVTTRGVVITIDTRIERGVRKEVGQGVRLGRNYVA